MHQAPIAVQLYTLRTECERQGFAATVRAVAALGYAGVEFAGFYGLTAPEVLALLEETGLKAAGAHVGLSALQTDLTGVIAFNRMIGSRYIICPWVGEEYRSEEGYRRLGEELTAIASRLRGAGLQLAYHNHDFEFQRFGGKTGLEILLASSDPDLVKVELDLYWAAYAGEDPVAWVRRLGARAPLLHFKDMAADRSMVSVGAGDIDFAAVAEAAGHAAWYIVEHDSPREPLVDITISRQNLRKMGL